MEATPPPPTPFAAPSEAPTPIPTPTRNSTSASPSAPVGSPVQTPRPGHVVVDANLVGPGIGWVLTDHAVLATDDDGQTWLDVTPAGRFQTYGLAALDRQTAYVASDVSGNDNATVRIYATADGGRTWHWSDLTTVPLVTMDGCGCGGHGVAIDVVSSLVVFVDVVVYSGTDSEGHDIFGSLDGGLTWKAMPWSIQAEGSGADLSIHFLTASVGTVLFDGRLFATDSGWGQWTEVDQAGRGFAPGPVTFIDSRHWITAGRLDFVDGAVPFAMSLDAGRTWTVETRTVPVTLGEGLGTAFAFIDSRTWVAMLGTRGPVETWISLNTGKTWTFVGDQPTSDPRRSTFVDRFNAWARDDAGGLATTRDGGATWSRIDP